jgi:hypothetical protein
MRDAVMGYLQVASGLTEVTRQRATAIAKALVDEATWSQAGEKVVETVSGAIGDRMDLAAGSAQMPAQMSAQVQAQVQALVEDLLAVARTNRDLLLTTVRLEVDRLLAARGLIDADEVNALLRRVDALQKQVGDLVAATGARAGRVGSVWPAATQEAAAGTETQDGSTSTPPKAETMQATAKKATKPATKPAAKATAKKTTAKKTTPKETTAKKATKKATKAASRTKTTGTTQPSVEQTAATQPTVVDEPVGPAVSLRAVEPTAAADAASTAASSASTSTPSDGSSTGGASQ